MNKHSHSSNSDILLIDIESIDSGTAVRDTALEILHWIMSLHLMSPPTPPAPLLILWVEFYHSEDAVTYIYYSPLLPVSSFTFAPASSTELYIYIIRLQILFPYSWCDIAEPNKATDLCFHVLQIGTSNIPFHTCRITDCSFIQAAVNNSNWVFIQFCTVVL